MAGHFISPDKWPAISGFHLANVVEWDDTQ
jgi:hypothetical protein